MKLQRAFKESLQQAERKEQLAKPMRTHFGPEETEEVKLALDSLGAQKKQKFKSDILRQIEVGPRLSEPGRQARFEPAEADAAERGPGLRETGAAEHAHRDAVPRGSQEARKPIARRGLGQAAPAQGPGARG